jgi:hypothetical protein
MLFVDAVLSMSRHIDADQRAGHAASPSSLRLRQGQGKISTLRLCQGFAWIVIHLSPPLRALLDGHLSSPFTRACKWVPNAFCVGLLTIVRHSDE